MEEPTTATYIFAAIILIIGLPMLGVIVWWLAENILGPLADAWHRNRRS